VDARRRPHLGARLGGRPEGEQRRRFEAICDADSWVLDTAYSAWLDVPLARWEAAGVPMVRLRSQRDTDSWLGTLRG
jgi:hypothetical protein